MPSLMLQPWCAAVSYVGNRAAQHAVAVGAVARMVLRANPARRFPIVG